MSNVTHNLGNGWTAVREGKLFFVYHNGEFKTSCVRLKNAKSLAKSSK